MPPQISHRYTRTVPSSPPVTIEPSGRVEREPSLTTLVPLQSEHDRAVDDVPERRLVRGPVTSQRPSGLNCAS